MLTLDNKTKMLTTVKELTLWALRKRRLWRVKGHSMYPHLADQDVVLIEPVTTKNPAATAIKPGDIVLAQHPTAAITIIKGVQNVDNTNSAVTLKSPSGNDSTTFGPVDLAAITGRVTYNLNRLEPCTYPLKRL